VNGASCAAPAAALSVPPAAPLPQEAAAGRIAPRGHPDLEAAMLRALCLLDPALARWSRAQGRRNMIARFWAGITGHFRLRATEWFAAVVLLQIGKTLYLPPAAFPVSESWRVMAAQMSEESWGILFLAIGGLRFAALAVNGTFAAFQFSPHIRFATAFMAAGLWTQVVMSMYEAAPNGVGWGHFALFIALELYNLWRAAADTGTVERLRRR
jgi:hypothetical protein